MGKKFKKLISLALSFAILATFCTLPMTASAEDTNLKFGSDGKFKIVIFSDVQDQYPVHQRVIRIMEQAIERETPDLVVFTGDMTEINTKDVDVDYRRTVEQILGPVVEAGIPYSIVFGNHDNQSYYTGTVTDRAAMLAVWQSIGNCLTTDPAPGLTGAGTCKIPIYASNGNDVAFSLWMVDSGSYQNPLDGKSGYGSVQDDQLAWMAANNDAGVNSIAFQHIPMPEMYNLFVEDANGTKTYNGKTYKLELIDGVTGKAGEFPAPCPADKSNEYSALKEMGNVLGVVTGHDHLNDFSGKFENDGLTMTAVPGMTYFNYGDEAVRGYGVIELDEADLSTYNYHSVKFSTLDAEAGGTTETVYDEYDEITYSDLKQNGNAVGESYTISGGHNFTYDVTSPSNSAVFKFRWTAGSKPGFQVSFDGAEDGNITYPFGLWIKRADQTEPNGSWHLKPNDPKMEVKMDSAVKQGDTYDIEMGRLKVLSGDPKNVGMYYIYLKVNGKLIKDGYTNTDENGGYVSNGLDCSLNNVIRFGAWGNGKDDIISEYVEPVITEEYAAFDVIEYTDLLNYDTLEPLAEEGMQLVKTDYSFKYNESQAAASTHSMILKVRWTMETLNYFQIHLGSYGGSNNFAYRMNYANWHDRATGNTIPVSPATVAGDYYDVEVARLMVTAGENTGKYYTYFKVDGEILFEKYVAADDENTTKYLTNTVYFGFKNDNTCFISATPYDPNPDSLYYAYDEVTYYDFLVNGNKISGDTFNVDSQTFTYDRTSDTGSVILKYRWKEANAGSSFQLSFDRADKVAYMFGMQFYQPGNNNFTNASIRLRPGLNDSKAWCELESNPESGKDYDIEFARLKVKNGEHKGDWHVYVKINDVLVAEDYVDGSLISKQGNYTTNPDSYAANVLSNTIYLTFWGNGGGNKIAPSPYVEAYDVYDEVTYDDFRIDGNSLPANGLDLGASRKITYNATSPSYSAKVKFRWTAGTEAKMVFYFDKWPNHPYGFAAKPPLTDVGGGAVAGENGAWHLDCSNNSNIVQMSKPIQKGETFDIEIGRLKVTNGKNKGLYYVYAIVNGELIKDYYTEQLADPAPSNIIRIVNGTAENIISSIPEAVEEPDVPVEPEEPEAPDALYYAYDEITYNDLKDANGNALGNEKVLSGGTTLTYDSTSATGSVLFRYRWTVGSVPKVQMSFEKASDSSMAYRFGAWLDVAADEYTNGSLWVGPSYGPKVNMPNALVAGGTYDVEFARLKVKNGENAGKYHVYYKLDGVLIAEYYVDADIVGENGNYTSGPDKNITLNVKSGEIFFAHWGSEGNKISATPVPETYEAYDEIGFDNLYVGDISMAGQTMTSDQNYTYNATSPSYSMIFKYRWIAGGDEMKFTTFLDDWVYPFCFAAKTPNQAGFGATAGPNGSWHLVPSENSFIVDMDTPVVAGQAYDIELARLKVANGNNAGKYYVYAKVNGELIQSYYYDGVSNGAYGNKNTQLSNKIIIAIPSGNKVTATPYVEEYEAYDEIGFEDLKDADGNSLGSQKAMSGANVFTYDKTSATGSVIFKYRWKIGDVAKFQMSFDKTANDAMAYMFGAWLSAPGEEANFPNGRMWLRPAYGPQVNLSEALVAGTSHNVEFARLKVKNGSNKGKYYVYIKIDDVLVAEDYVAADVVDANGNYTTNPGNTTLALSNEIFFAFWGSEGNIITSYRDGNATHEGSVGDFDNDGVIDAADLVVLRKILLGTQDTSEMPEGIADFNIDGKVNILDLVAMKKYLAPANTYARQGSLALGTQEHLLSDSTKTAEYIADASAVLGASAYRLSRPIHTLYNATSSNGVTVNETNMAQFREMVEALKAKGITEILYVTDAFVLPYGYYNSETTHHKTVPDPETDTENYIAWLTVNAAAFKALAEEFPEIKYFEPYNEPNVGGNRLEKYGIGWNATEEEQAAHAFTTKEKAGIMADLCWNISRAVKSVDTANQVTTPSLSVDTNHSHVDGTFLDALYAAIEAGNHPTNRVVADKRVDNYFTIINIHSYVSYSSSQAQNNVNEWAARINAAYDVVKAHGDGGSRVWLSETGMSTSVSDGRDEDTAANFIKLALEKLDSNITFIDTVFIYKLADVSSDMGQSAIETAYGLFYSGDDLDNPYGAKATAKAVYSFCHNGSTDYSELDALVSRYAE